MNVTHKEENDLLRKAVSDLILLHAKLYQDKQELEGALIHEQQNVRELTDSISRLESKIGRMREDSDRLTREQDERLRKAQSETREWMKCAQRFEYLCKCRNGAIMHQTPSTEWRENYEQQWVRMP